MIDIILLVIGSVTVGWAAEAFYWEYKHPFYGADDTDMPHSNRQRYEKTIE